MAQAVDKAQDEHTTPWATPKNPVVKGAFSDGRRRITKDCGAELRTIDICIMPDGSIKSFDNVAYVKDAINCAAQYTINYSPVLTMASVLSTTYGSEGAVAGIKSGTIGGQCHFITGGENLIIEGHPVLRDGDLGIANNGNTAPAQIVHPERYTPIDGKPYEYDHPDSLPEVLIGTEKVKFKFLYTDGKVPNIKAFKMVFKNSKRPTGVKLKLGLGTLFFSKQERETESLIIDTLEMLDCKTGYPTHYQEIDLKTCGESVTIKILPPPICIDLSPFATKCPSNLLTYEQIQYFKRNGNNALIFIHGYSVKAGTQGHYPTGFTTMRAPGSPHETAPPYIAFKGENYPRTIACHYHQLPELMDQLSGLAPYYPYSFKSYHPEHCLEILNDMHFINGTHSCQWHTMMEYNFNRAAGFKGNYEQYTRILHIHWPGDTDDINFGQAEDIAKQYGRLPDCGLSNIIKTLHFHNIEVNIVAHSLGTALLMHALSKIGQELVADYAVTKTKKSPPIQQVILWQAAIPNTVFAEDVHSHHDARCNSHFPYAIEACNKINVLHSKRDTVLQLAYTTSKLVTLCPHDVANGTWLEIYNKRGTLRDKYFNANLKERLQHHPACQFEDAEKEQAFYQAINDSYNDIERNIKNLDSPKFYNESDALHHRPYQDRQEYKRQLYAIQKKMQQENDNTTTILKQKKSELLEKISKAGPYASSSHINTLYKELETCERKINDCENRGDPLFYTFDINMRKKYYANADNFEGLRKHLSQGRNNLTAIAEKTMKAKTNAIRFHQEHPMWDLNQHYESAFSSAFNDTPELYAVRCNEKQNFIKHVKAADTHATNAIHNNYGNHTKDIQNMSYSTLLNLQMAEPEYYSAWQEHFTEHLQKEYYAKDAQALKNKEHQLIKDMPEFYKAARAVWEEMDKAFLDTIWALGYEGLPENDYIDKLEAAGKIKGVDQGNYLGGHSYMKNPTDELMEEIYKEFVIAHEGIKKFGHYIILPKNKKTSDTKNSNKVKESIFIRLTESITNFLKG